MIKKFKSKKLIQGYIDRFASEYVNMVGILIALISFKEDKIANWISVVLFILLILSLIRCTDFKKTEIFNQGFKLFITLTITYFITINDELSENNIWLIIGLFVLTACFSLKVDKSFYDKYFDEIVGVKLMLIAFILTICFCISSYHSGQPYFITNKDESFFKYINLLNGVVITGIPSLIIELIRFNNSPNNIKIRKIGIRKQGKNKLRKK